jgi:hypothetical protein
LRPIPKACLVAAAAAVLDDHPELKNEDARSTMIQQMHCVEAA